MSQPILKVEGLQAKYGDFLAVESATLDVPAGKIVPLSIKRRGKVNPYGHNRRHTYAQRRKSLLQRRRLPVCPLKSWFSGACPLYLRQLFYTHVGRGQSHHGQLSPHIREGEGVLDFVYSLFPVLKEKRHEPSAAHRRPARGATAAP